MSLLAGHCSWWPNGPTIGPSFVGLWKSHVNFRQVCREVYRPTPTNSLHSAKLRNWWLLLSVTTHWPICCFTAAAASGLKKPLLGLNCIGGTAAFACAKIMGYVTIVIIFPDFERILSCFLPVPKPCRAKQADVWGSVSTKSVWSGLNSLPK